MDNVQIFKNDEFGSVRVLMIDGKPWFVGKDVADALGYKNSRVALQDNVKAKHKGVTKVTTFGGDQDMVIIDEPGLFSLVFGSSLDSAEKFQDWVYEEVLPSIFTTGSYSLQVPKTYAEALRAYADEVEKTEALQRENLLMRPKADYCDTVLSSKDLIPIRVIAKDYGMSSMQMNKILNNLGIQFKQSGMWHLYQPYAKMNLAASKTYAYDGNDGAPHNAPHTYWTQEGRLFIYNLLKDHGILPITEQHKNSPVAELPNYEIGGTLL